MQEAALGWWAYSPLAKDAVHIRVRQENAGVEAGRPIVRLSMYYLLVQCVGVLVYTILAATHDVGICGGNIHMPAEYGVYSYRHEGDWQG